MKKTKTFILGLSFITVTTFFLSSSVHAKFVVNNKQIKTETCTDDEGHTTGAGNTCIDSQNFNCLANPCK